MSSYQKQIRSYGIALVIYVIFNAAIWHLFTHRFFDPIYYVGDLARLSYLLQYAQPHQEKNTLPKQQISYHKWKGQPIDIITMGDSFSTAGGLGINNYYQDWLATHHNLNVMNLPKLSNKISNVQTVFILLNSGFLDQFSPRAILLEDIGREVPKIHGHKINPDQKWPLHQIKSVYSTQSTAQVPSYSFLNSGNIKFLIHQILYTFDDNAILSQVYKTTLKQPSFSQGTGNTLLFYGEDVENVSLIEDKSIALVTQNLNTLAERLAQKGIALYYMPVVDKLALYHSQIQDPRYPQSQLFNKLKEHPRLYQLIDTEAILSSAIAEGEKDIFFVDDTHWTWRACKRIAEAFVFPPDDSPQSLHPLSTLK